MKSRKPYLLHVALFLLVASCAPAGLHIFQTPGSTRMIPATINQDCAPWDGAAFTVSLPVSDGTITISIWQAPDIKLPVRFKIPAQGGQAGSAVYRHAAGPPQQLFGEVSFLRVEHGTPVDGSFDLGAASGSMLKGRFRAEWGNFMALCG